MLQKSISRIYPYGSDKPLELKGQFKTTLESKTRFTPAVIQVAKGKAWQPFEFPHCSVSWA